MPAEWNALLTISIERTRGEPFMNIGFFDDFKDDYMQTLQGKGYFLSGVVLGMVARGQAGKGSPIDSAPLYKQLHFGKLQRRDILRHMSRIPELTRVYNLDYAGMIESLCAKAGEYLMLGGASDPGVDGNFAFSMAFLNAPDYFFKRIFKKTDEDQKDGSEILKEGHQ